MGFRAGGVEASHYEWIRRIIIVAFDPFDKQMNELTREDLDSLIQKEVAEGYWVEYKSSFQENRKVAKSISSFANTYGGWYFIGIEAKNSVASKIVGVSLKEIRDPVDKLREIVKSHIDPTPVFYHKTIQLDEPDKVVVVVHIPDNQETPFIVSDGRIYRRVGDSSEPVLENNRYAIDRLVDEGKNLAKEFEEFCQDDRTFSKAEEGQSWLSIYITPYPLGFINRVDMLSEEGIEKLLSLSQTSLKHYVQGVEIGYGNYPLNSGKTGLGSVVLRQVEPAKAGFNSPTIEFFYDGRAKFHFPLSLFSILGKEGLEQLKSVEAKKALNYLLDADRDSNLHLLRFFNIQEMWNIMLNHFSFYKAWYGQDIENSSIKTAVIIHNTWRLVPVHDSDIWGRFVQKYGLPIQSSDSIRVPVKKGKGLVNKSIQWEVISSFIGMAFGLPFSMFTDLMFGDKKEI